jgi:predicted nucleic acid-binding protein
MRIYADTSALIAWFHPADEFAQAITNWCRERSPEFCWNPLLRVELRHNLRRLSGSYASAAWHAYRASETSRKLRLESDRLSDLLERADELSASHARVSRAGTWDCVHIAAAQRSRAEIFITCDAAQAELAKLVLVAEVHLFN